MPGPASQVIGEVVRPKFQVHSLIDHALGEYEKGDDGDYYLNGGVAHIVAISGRGNVFKTTLLDFLYNSIQLRYNTSWGSKYDAEVSAQLSRVETAMRSALRYNKIVGVDPEINIMAELIGQQRYNLAGADVLPGEQWFAKYMRDEVEARFKEYTKGGKSLRVTPFPDPIRKANKAMLDPWLYGLDSASEWHTGTLEDKHRKSEIGSADQNILNANDALHKANMMGRWPVMSARGNYYIGFTVHLTDGMVMGGQDANTGKLLDDFKGELKFAGVPRRAVTFLTNSFLVATASGECKQPQTYDKRTGTSEPMFPTSRSKGMASSSNDLKIVRYTQFRAKSGPTGVKMDLLFSQEEGFLGGLSNWYYIKEVLPNDYGITRSGHFYALDILPETKFQRTTVRDQLDDDPKLARAMEIVAGLGWMQNNWHTLPQRFQITPAELYQKVIDAGYDWDEILTGTVEYWTFEDQKQTGILNEAVADIIGVENKWKPTMTVRTLLAIAVDGHKTNKLTCKK